VVLCLRQSNQFGAPRREKRPDALRLSGSFSIA
jgi:hypothetical protein